MGLCFCPSGSDTSVSSVERTDTMKLRIEMKHFEVNNDQLEAQTSESDSDWLISLNFPSSSQQGKSTTKYATFFR